ncbi:MAG: protein of unknown function with transrane region [Parcubacteria group bacterium]|nr:protein of unknown function with transrane region [Parcubacteria group bacterium]
MQTSGPDVHFLNVEYFFRLLYNLFHGIHGGAGGGVSTGGLLAVLSHLWLLLTVLAYLFSLAAIGVFVYATLRLFQTRKDEEPRYETITPEAEHALVEHSRWKYIMQLIESGLPGDWRNAIIESDIMLDELLSRLGYPGISVGEKLKAANFRTIRNAWDAHMVRNDIAHQGSAFELTEHVAHRTIANYEAVFREHNEI